jgi:hypothetical protein
MSSPFNLLSPQARRPKAGSGFALVRLAGWTLGIVGGLLSMSALLGFLVILVKVGPMIVEALQFPEQKMGGFIILIASGGLLLFVLLGLAGIICLGLGLVFGRWGTESSASGMGSETV